MSWRWRNDLLDPQKKAAYDAECRQRQAAEVPGLPNPPPPPAPAEEFAASVADPDWGVEGSSATVRLRRRSRRVAPTRGTEPVGSASGTRTADSNGNCYRRNRFSDRVLGVVIRVQTNYGTVKIEILEENANVEVKLDGETISVEGLGQPLRLPRPGAHELVVNGQNYETVCTSFTVHRGNNPVLTVTLVPTNVCCPTCRFKQTHNKR